MITPFEQISDFYANSPLCVSKQIEASGMVRMNRRTGSTGSLASASSSAHLVDLRAFL